MLYATKSAHEKKVVSDSETERSFAQERETNTAVKLYAKLPEPASCYQVSSKPCALDAGQDRFQLPNFQVIVRR